MTPLPAGCRRVYDISRMGFVDLRLGILVLVLLAVTGSGVLTLTWLLIVARRRERRLAVEVDIMRGEISTRDDELRLLRRKLSELQKQALEFSHQLAERAESRMERELWNGFTATRQRISEFTAFLNREFPTECGAAQIQVPPAHFLDVTQNLLAELLQARRRLRPVVTTAPATEHFGFVLERGA